MICPYCQHDLDVDSMACPRCGAEYPRGRKPYGVGIRMTVFGVAMMTMISLVLVECVFSGLPDLNSPQQQLTAPPDFKSAEVQAQLRKWRQGQQNTELPTASPLRKGN